MRSNALLWWDETRAAVNGSVSLGRFTARGRHVGVASESLRSE